MLPENLIRFVNQFDPVLKKSVRWPSFLRIALELFSLNRPVFIGETGSLRLLGNWHGDGQSTFLWDFIAKATLGHAFSVDSNIGAFELVKSHCPHVTPFCDDSIQLLASLDGVIESFDLLYLDSMDYNNQTALSELHHAGELAVCYPKLKSGCLIAVDDCHEPDRGKHVLIKTFFDRFGIPPLIEGYVTVWRKP